MADHLFSFYHEGDISGRRTSSGASSERYGIQSHSLRAMRPVGERSVGVDIM